MKIVFLTTDEYLYLPLVFEKLLQHLSSSFVEVYMVPPRFGKGKNKLRDSAWRFLRTFGIYDFLGLLKRIVEARLKNQTIANVCQKFEVNYANIVNVNSIEFLEKLNIFAPDIIVSVSCPQVFKKPLIEIPRLGCINIHGAILPDYRGTMPSFWMMANGETKAGVSVFFVDEGIDTGDLCGQSEFSIDPHESLDKFIQRSKMIGADLLLQVIQDFDSGIVKRWSVNHNDGRYFSWPDAEAVKKFRARGRSYWG